MINCLKCKKPLTLVIDITTTKFYCINCNHEYSVNLKNKKMEISSNKKRIKLLLNGISFCNNKLLKKTVYELYSGGYVNCVKSLNTEFNNHDNKWIMPVNKLLNLSLKNYSSKIDSLNQKQTSLNLGEQSYNCNSCKTSYSFEDSLKNNFNCATCSLALSQSNKVHDANNIQNEINLLKKEAELLSCGWC